MRVRTAMSFVSFVFTLSLAVSASAQQAAQCGTTAQAFAGDPGTTFTVACPANCTSGPLWGTDIYSDDSAICVAAVHAGVITATGGNVQVTIAPGQDSYAPSTRNGVSSSSWPAWGRSFTVASGASTATALSCGQSAQTLSGDAGATHLVTCPSGCGGATVWGTGVYSDDSAICAAAIHAGVISSGGGTFTVTIAPGQSSYQPSTANGITTSSWGSWGRSFTVAQ